MAVSISGRNLFAVFVSGKVFVAVSFSGRNLFAVLVFCGGRSIHGVGYGHARQVFPDDKTEAPIGDARLDLEKPLPPSVARVRELKAQLGTAGEASTKRIQKELKSHAYRVPNQYFAQSIDSCLRTGLGLSLNHFRPTRCPGLLGRSERRYFLPPEASKACPMAAEDDHPELQRSCIENLDTGARWLELPLQTDLQGRRMLPPALHLCIDRGSTGMPGAMWLFSQAGVAGTLHGDFCQVPA